MAGIKSKQIDRFDDAFIAVTGLTVSSADSDIVTADLTTAATTAARDNGTVPVQAATLVAEGFVTSGEWNKVVIQGADGGGMESADGTEVYGRLTEAGGVFTLSYFYLDAAGTETPFTMAAQDVSAYFPYRFKFANLPRSALLGLKFSDVNSIGASQMLAEVLITPTATNTLPDLPVTPTGIVTYAVNGQGIDELPGGGVSRVGNVLTWSAVNAGYDVETTDRVTAKYVL